jgi:hypothetical protein
MAFPAILEWENRRVSACIGNPGDVIHQFDKYFFLLFQESPLDDATTYTPLLEDIFVVTSSFIGKSKETYFDQYCASYSKSDIFLLADNC